MMHKEWFDRISQGVKMGFDLGTFQERESMTALAGGLFIFDMRDAETGAQLEYWERKNIIVLDAGILAARLFKNSTSPNPGMNNGLTMLGVGTGATGNLLSPDAPQQGQRKLNEEIARKAFASTQFRNANGVAVSYPTSTVDFTTTFGEAEAVGPLNEMGLMSTYSTNPLIKHPILNGPTNYDPTIDITGKDLMVNYLTFSVVTKPSTAVLTITWRLSF